MNTLHYLTNVTELLVHKREVKLISGSESIIHLTFTSMIRLKSKSDFFGKCNATKYKYFTCGVFVVVVAVTTVVKGNA